MKKGPFIQKLVGGILRYLIATVSLSVLFYILFALVFSTREERQLQRENNLYRERYAQLQEKEKLIGDVVEGLLDKDNAIYEELFETPAPALDALTAADLIAESDSLSPGTLRIADNVDANFSEIFRLMESRRDSIPPLTLPLKGMSYVQAGASVGIKHNPVTKLSLQHDGLDLIAPQGTGVYAAAAGTVSQVTHSRKGLGNTVVISHGNGYSTRYCLLGDIHVSGGQRVRRGQKLGTVGISASVAAPHLHFEVRYKDEVRDPVHYLFASLTPEEYSRVMYMAASTAQSLD